MVLVGDKTECDGPEIFKGELASLGDCAEKCQGLASMFVFGTNDYGTERCYNIGCHCYCETSATTRGTCRQKNNDGYRLYKYVSQGKYYW